MFSWWIPFQVLYGVSLVNPPNPSSFSLFKFWINLSISPIDLEYFSLITLKSLDSFIISLFSLDESSHCFWYITSLLFNSQISQFKILTSDSRWLIVSPKVILLIELCWRILSSSLTEEAVSNFSLNIFISFVILAFSSLQCFMISLTSSTTFSLWLYLALLGLYCLTTHLISLQYTEILCSFIFSTRCSSLF